MMAEITEREQVLAHSLVSWWCGQHPEGHDDTCIKLAQALANHAAEARERALGACETYLREIEERWREEGYLSLAESWKVAADAIAARRGGQ